MNEITQSKSHSTEPNHRCDVVVGARLQRTCFYTFTQACCQQQKNGSRFVCWFNHYSPLQMGGTDCWLLENWPLNLVPPRKSNVSCVVQLRRLLLRFTANSVVILFLFGLRVKHFSLKLRLVQLCLLQSNCLVISSWCLIANIYFFTRLPLWWLCWVLIKLLEKATCQFSQFHHGPRPLTKRSRKEILQVVKKIQRTYTAHTRDVCWENILWRLFG